jgi:phage-related protein
MAVMEALLKIRADVTGQQAVDKLGNALHSVGTRGTTAMNSIKTATAGALGVVRTFVPALGAVALGKFAKDTIDSADAMSKLSQRTGISAPELDRFRKVAELSDTSIESLSKAFPALASNIQKASQGSGPAADAFKQLGISVTDASGNLRSTDDVMLQVADRFAQMEDGTEKAALASEIFGRRLGSELIPMLNSGGDAVRNMSTSLTQEFADKAAVFNDRIENMTEKVQDLGLRLTIALLPAFEALVGLVEQIANVFEQLPEPLQNLTVTVGLLAGAWALLGPVITPLIGLLQGLAALNLGATIAGWAGAIVPLMGALKGLGALILGVFTGPVGWVALAVAAGVAIYAFRDQVADAFKVIGDVIKGAAEFFYNSYVKPVITAGDLVVSGLRSAFDSLASILTNPFETAVESIKNLFRSVRDTAGNLVSGLKSAFSSLASILSSPFKTAVESIKNLFRSLLNFVASGINKATSSIRTLISNYNSIPVLSNVPNIPTVSVPAFAAGGVVSQPTLAVVGEAGREYIIPESKMAAAAANYLSGVRGDAVIPTFANGGTAGAAAGGGAANTTVQITTGPVLQQQDGQRYVTIGDLERALQDYGDQIFRNSRSYGGRRYQGAY